jgi:hypothetical protein
MEIVWLDSPVELLEEFGLDERGIITSHILQKRSKKAMRGLYGNMSIMSTSYFVTTYTKSLYAAVIKSNYLLPPELRPCIIHAYEIRSVVASLYSGHHSSKLSI